jgi:hypothetical protein
MRIEQDEYVAAASRHESLRRPSAQLHVSQPALSEAISKLERELGVTLIDRHRSGPGSVTPDATCWNRSSTSSSAWRDCARPQATSSRRDSCCASGPSTLEL